MKVINLPDGTREYEFFKQCNPTMPEDEARDLLLSLGVSIEQMEQVTGFGHRSGYDCKPDDTVLNKFRCGALSKIGVMGEVFGVDSPQHHKGHNLPND